MILMRTLAAAALSVVIAACGAAQAAPLEAYGKLPTIEEAQISPDGSTLAYVVTDGERRRVVVQRVSDNKIMTGLNVGDRKLREIQWAGPDHLLISVSQAANVIDLTGPKREYLMLEDFDLSRNRQKWLMADQEDSMNTVFSTPEVRIIDGTPIVFIHGIYFVSNKGRLALYQYNIKTGITKRIEASSEDTDDWTIDANGQVLARMDYTQRSGHWSLKTKLGFNNWKELDANDAPTGAPGLYGLGPDGHSLIVGDAKDDDSVVYRQYAIGGEPKAPEPLDEALHGLIEDPVTHALIGGTATIGDELRYTFLAPHDQAVWRGVAKAFPGDRVELVSWSNNRRQIVVLVDGPTNGVAYALVDLDKKSAEWLGDLYKDLPAREVAEVRSVTYKAADGLEISGYLTLPRGRDPKDLPLVVFPHGGPQSRDAPGFDWWAQAMASRGYAVLQPNYRGSSGYGWKFLSAGFGQWGRKMQTDLSDGVRYLAAQGTIDPKRVCIVGASYGGYAALAGATLDTGVYRCAASVAGVADLRKMLQYNQVRYGGGQNSGLRYWTRFMGVDGVKDPDLADISPDRHADKVNIPILLVHGKDDTVVPYDQSDAMADALKKAGKPFTLVTLNHEDHWLSQGDTRLQMLQAVISFLETNNPPN